MHWSVRKMKDGRSPELRRHRVWRPCARHLRARVTFSAGRDERTLEQIYERPLKISIRDRSAHAQLDSLITGIAADISHAKRFPLLGVPTVGARPVSAWRERYGAIDQL